MSKNKLFKITFSIVLGLTIILGGTSQVLAANSGPRNAGTGADVTGVGTVTWSNPSRITADDNNYATADVSPNAITHYLRATNYGFTIPSNATIDGIQVTIGRQSSGQSQPFIRDNIVRLVKNNNIVGNNNANTSSDWPTSSIAAANYGGTSNLWGTDWTVDDINNSNFGVALSVKNANTKNNRNGTASVDYIQITITYTTPTTGTLTVTKVAIGGNGTFNVTGSGSLGSLNITTTAGSGSNSFTNVTPGTYNITETVPVGWEKTGDTCQNINVTAGNTATCTITNTKLPTLTVTKVVINNSGGTKTVSDFPLFINGTSVTSGIASTLTPGDYTVTETNDPDYYTATFSGDCNSNGQVTLAAGENKTCTITNDDIHGDNLVPNPSFEIVGGDNLPANWQTSSWGTNDVTFEYPVEGTGGAGTKAAKTTINSYTDGDAKWYFFDDVSVTPGQYYEFSDKYISNIQSEVNVRYHITGTPVGEETSYKYESIGIAASSPTWQTFKTGIVIPLDVDSLTIFHLLAGMGNLTVDDYSLIQMDNPDPFTKGIVSLSFDDGWKSTYNNINLLDGYKGTFYIINNEVGNTDGGYMTQSEIDNLYNQGNDIAAHSKTHTSLISPTVNLQSETAESRYDLIGTTGKPMDSFAYPYGDYNDAAKAALKGAGFLGARTVDGGFNSKTTDRFQLRAQPVERTTTLNDVQAWIDLAAEEKSWLILLFHQIDNNSADVYGTTPEMLEGIVDYIATKNVDVKTISQGLHLMPGTPAAGDTIIPEIASHENIIKESKTAITVDYTVPAVTDNIDTVLVSTCNPISGSVFEIGTTTVTCNTADTSGNLAIPTTFTVIVQDSAPVITGTPADITVEATSASGAIVEYTLPTATDAIDGDVVVTCELASGSTFPMGENIVICSATDSSSNTATSNFKVTVQDTTAPVIADYDNITAEATSADGATVSYTAPEATDLVDGSTQVSCTPISDSIFPLGKTTVACTSQDNAGNIANSSFDIVVNDTTAPVITAPTDINQEANGAESTVSDLGVPEVSDIVDTNPLIINNAPATYALGITDVTWTATDASGNSATAVQKVTIVDTTAPVITAPESQTFEATDSLTTPILTEATALDIADVSPVITYEPHSFPLGITDVTWTATDASGNSATATSQVEITDKTAPIIASHDNVTAEATSPLGAIVTYDYPLITDNYDVDIVPVCAPASGSQFAFGDTIVTCDATDSNGNTATQTNFTISVVDTTKPIITLNGDNPMTVEINSSYSEPGAIVTDNYDTELTATITGSVDVNTIGSYEIDYNVSDSHENNAIEVTRIVNVVDTGIPVITLLGDSDVTVEVNNQYNDAGATAFDNYDGDITLNIVTVNPVDTTIVGNYNITYNVSDSSSNKAIEVFRTVHIVDITIPTIELVGDNPQIIEAGNSYTELEATVTDNYDTSLSAIINASAVNTNSVGSYKVTYDATDSSGNNAIQIIRTVNVIDTVDPEVSVTTPSSPTNGHPSINFSVIDATAATTECKINDGEFSSCTSPFEPTLDSGTYTVTVRATDEGNNIGENTTEEFVVDATAPVIAIDSAPDALINIDTAIITFHIDGDYETLICKHNGSDIDSCTPTSINFTELSQGEHTVIIKATDSLGNESNLESIIFTVDTIAPQISVNSPVATNDNTPTITGTTDDDTANVLVTINSTVYTATPSLGLWSITTDVLADGEYSISAQSTDAAGNVSLTVNGTLIINTEAPNLTVNNPAPNSTEITGTTDDDTTVVVTIDSVDYDAQINSGTWTLTLGALAEASYPVLITATDGFTNSAQASTTLIIDITAPVITLINDANIDVNIYDTYTDAGATAADNVDNDVTSSIVTVNSVDVNTIGAYTVTYNVSDTAGNAATEVVRTVNVKDLAAPVITLLGDNPTNILLGQTYTDAGATAADNVDNDVTSSIVTVNSVDVNTIGAYTVTYNVSDTAGNAATEVVRTVNVSEATPPTIDGVQNDTNWTDSWIDKNLILMNVNWGSLGKKSGQYRVNGGEWNDISFSVLTQGGHAGETWGYIWFDIEGELSVDIKLVNNADKVFEGSYTMRIDKAPVITLNGESPINLLVGQTYTDAGATAEDTKDGDITENIITTGLPIDTNIVGAYTVTYNVSDTAGNTTETTRTINVGADTTNPVITLLGNAIVNITVSQTYTDAGATALDDLDGDITENIITVNPVNINIAGTYTVTYDVSDAAGNEANQISRTVNVNAAQVVVTGGGGGGGYVNSNPPTPPTGGYSIKINNDAATTSNVDVTLTINGGSEAKKMAISNSEDFTSAVQENYVTSKKWTLASGEGTKKVCIKFYSQSGYSSAPVCDEIKLTGESSFLFFNTLMINWGQTGENPADLNHDGKVDILDFNLLMVSWS